MVFNRSDLQRVTVQHVGRRRFRHINPIHADPCCLTGRASSSMRRAASRRVGNFYPRHIVPRCLIGRTSNGQRRHAQGGLAEPGPRPNPENRVSESVLSRKCAQVDAQVKLSRGCPGREEGGRRGHGNASASTCASCLCADCRGRLQPQEVLFTGLVCQIPYKTATIVRRSNSHVLIDGAGGRLTGGRAGH